MVATRHDAIEHARIVATATVWILSMVIAVSAVASAPAVAHETPTPSDGGGQGGEAPCSFDHPDWRSPAIVAGVRVSEDPSCRPDNPAVVAAVTRGTNDVPDDILSETGLSRNAVVKGDDRDGDGDPDLVHVTLEVMGVNEHDASGAEHAIAPGIRPAFWVFAPKTRGMVERGSAAERLIRPPSPSIRVEQGDRVRVTIENTHYLPHTLHLHGVDHPYMVNGSGNDGVPQTSEEPILPGERRTYEFTPREAGTMFYHCHVVPDVHVMMGLNGLFVIEANRSDNRVQTINVGAGRVRHPSRAVRANYSGEYDLHYQEVDAELHTISKRLDDPRAVAKATNREYELSEASPDYFLLNGRSFPYTLRESLVVVEPEKRYRLRVVNGGMETVSLHTHGHKVTVEAEDGVELSADQKRTRDVVTITAAQRLDLALNTTNDGLHSYGSGVWFLHDHREQAVTTDGISPGGDVGMIVYRLYLADDGIPHTETNLSRYFDSSFYEGDVPAWGHLDPERLGEPPSTETGSDTVAHPPITDRSLLGPLPVWVVAVGLLGTLVFLGGMVVLLLIGGDVS